MSHASSPSLTEPIVNRYRRRKLGKKFWWTLLAVLFTLMLIGLVVVYLRRAGKAVRT